MSLSPSSDQDPEVTVQTVSECDQASVHYDACSLNPPRVLPANEPSIVLSAGVVSEPAPLMDAAAELEQTEVTHQTRRYRALSGIGRTAEWLVSQHYVVITLLAVLGLLLGALFFLRHAH